MIALSARLPRVMRSSAVASSNTASRGRMVGPWRAAGSRWGRSAACLLAEHYGPANRRRNPLILKGLCVPPRWERHVERVNGSGSHLPPFDRVKGSLGALNYCRLEKWESLLGEREGVRRGW